MASASYARLAKSYTITNRNYPSSILNRPASIDEDFDCVKVEICDVDNVCPNATSVTLMKCKKQIIVPFRKLLCLIGWRSFGGDGSKCPAILLRLINIIYPMFIFLILLFNYTYEVLLCQGRLNFKIDTQAITTTTEPPLVNVSLNWSSVVHGKRGVQSHECGHIFTTYILPDIFHCMAFLIGLIYFRITEGESVYSLMEKVFINADENMRVSNTNRVIRRLKIFMLISCVWTIFSVATAVFSNAINSFSSSSSVLTQSSIDFIMNKNPNRYVFFALDIICRFVSHSIYMAVVMNYVCYCELVIFYCKSIRLRLEEKSIELAESMKRIVDLGLSLSQLNSATSRMMSISIIIFLARFILGEILLIANRIFTTEMWVYRSLYAIVWFSILAFCLGQASRVANKLEKFRRISLSMRVYGYHNAEASELDSFILFLSQADLRIKLFGLAVRPGKILGVGVIAFLILMVLFQSSLITTSEFPI